MVRGWRHLALRALLSASLPALLLGLSQATPAHAQLTQTSFETPEPLPDEVWTLPTRRPSIDPYRPPTDPVRPKAKPTPKPSPSAKPTTKPTPTPKPTPRPSPGPFSGKYETGWDKVPTIELVMRQEGSRLRGGLTLVADRLGARVLTAEFHGKVAGKGGHLNWHDSAGNTGVATFWNTKGDAWELESRITRPTNDGRWLEGRYYLRKTADSVLDAQLPDENAKR